MATLEESKQHLKEADLILLNVPNYKYFGILSYGLKKNLVSSEDIFKDFGYPPGSVGGYTDGKSITYCYDQLKSRSDFIFLTLHELLHIILSHIDRKGDRNEILWNFAGDHVVNSIIKEISETQKHLNFPGHVVYYPDIAEKYPNANAELVYDLLLDEMGGEKALKKMQDSLSVREYDATVKGNPDGSKYIEITDKTTGKKFAVPLDTDIKNAPSSDDDDSSQSEKSKACEDLKNKAKTVWHSESSELRGRLPNSVVDYLNEIYKIEIPWESLAEDAILYSVQAKKRRTWSAKNFYIRNVRVPGKYDRSMDKKIFLASIDTSASISDEDLKKFSGVVSSTLKHFHGLYVIYHDVEISNEIVYEKKPNEHELYENLKQIKGRGGTSHRDVFKKISDIVINHNVSIMTFLTDFYSDVEQEYKKYEWVNDYPMIWMICNNREMNDDKIKSIMPECDVKAVNIDDMSFRKE